MVFKQSTLRYLDELMTRYPALTELTPVIMHAAEILHTCYSGGGKVLVCGNGGSAADSDHIVGELVKSFVLRREIPSDDAMRLRESGCDDWQEIANKLQGGISAIALTGYTALSTAIQNDTDADMIFAQPVYVCGRPGDVLIALSTSGNSGNIVNALKVARTFGLKTIGLTGKRPARMDEWCDALIKVPEEETFKIQEFHLPIYHALCLMLEHEIFSS